MRFNFLIFIFLTCFVLIDAKNHFEINLNSDQSRNENLVELRDGEKSELYRKHLLEYRHKNNHQKINYAKSQKKFFLKKEFPNNVAAQTLQCGYESCRSRKEDKINVHVISFSHDDVGWLKTVDQYYYGNRNDIQRAGVQYIITSVIEELKKDPKRKFIFVEVAFFQIWWKNQDEDTKTFVRQLVDEGRFEFISGGWSMNDEAAAHYISIIDQMTLGHQWLLHNFGECAIPKIGWQIDPFGHSREQANLFAQMGFDGLFIGRLDYLDKSKREKEKTLEILWRGSDNLGKDSDLFTGILPNTYNPPNGFCFDDTCADEAIVDDKQSPDYNVDRRVNEYIKAVLNQAENYKTKDLIHTMGSDFQYQNALPWYLNLDRLMKYVNEKNSSINVFYSTPTCYLKALNEANLTWNTKTDDFFPYSSDPHAYWAGYFTSRPAFKGFERWASGHLQSTKHLQILANLVDEKHNQLRDRLREALGIAQHHDAITGTEKQHVYSDYVLNLNKGVDAANQLISNSLNKIYNSSNYSPQITENEVEFCKKLNVSECELTEKENKFIIHLYNPMAHSVQHVVRLPVKNLKNENAIILLNAKGEKISYNVVEIAEYVKNLPERNSKAEKEIVFLAHLNATSLATFSIDLTNASTGESNEKNNDYNLEQSRVLESGVLEGLGFKLHVDIATGTTQKIVLNNGDEIKFEHEYKYYLGMAGNNSNFELRASGAYIFRPNGTIKTLDKENGLVKIIFNSNFNEVQIKKTEFVAETIRVHKNLPYIELDYVIGPIPVEDELGKEIVSTFKTDLKTDGVFYTDSNGRQLIKRRRNKRPTYSYDPTIEPIASNYYPLNSRIEIRDENRKLRLAVLTDRSQGGSSINDGEIEIMVHRRLLYDDAFGVNEALNEPGLKPGKKGDGLIIRGTHRLLINTLNKDQETENTVKELVARQALQPMIAFRKLNENVDTTEIYVKSQEESILRSPLSKCVNLLTLEAYAHYKIVRFEHLYGKLDLAQCSDQIIELDMSKLFDAKYKAYIYAETFLTANQVKGSTRLSWRSDFDEKKKEGDGMERRVWQNKDNLLKSAAKKIDHAYTSKFKIQPSEIKTFLIFLDDETEMI